MKCFILLTGLLLGGANLANAQTKQGETQHTPKKVEQVETLPPDFPKPPTANSSPAAVAEYNASKEDWIVKHPAAYAALQQKPTQAKRISRAEFLTYPTKKQEAILAYPERFIIVD